MCGSRLTFSGLLTSDRLKFKVADYYIQDKCVIMQDSVKIEITAKHAPAGFDRVYIHCKIDGIKFIRSCEDILSFESNSFEIYEYTGPAYKCGNKENECCLYLVFEHKELYKAPKPVIEAYLDSTYLKIIIDKIVSERQVIDVVFNKKKMFEGLGVDYFDDDELKGDYSR